RPWPAGSAPPDCAAAWAPFSRRSARAMRDIAASVRPARAAHPRIAIEAVSLAEALRAEGASVRYVPINPRFPAGLRWVRHWPYARTIVNEMLYLPSLAGIHGADVVHVFAAAYWSFLLGPAAAITLARALRKRVILNYHSGEAEHHLACWG